MDFNQFLALTKEMEKAPLGGLDSQFKFAPKLRLKYSLEKIKASQPKEAAVLALFYPDANNSTHFLLTQRANYNGTHSAQISFPGGKIEDSDASKKQAALREAQEEVGIDMSSISVFKEMTDVFIPPSNFLATPFLGFSHNKPEFTTNHEVSKLIEIPIKELLNDDNIKEFPMQTSYMGKINVPCFYFDKHIVWGATAMMLSEIRDLF
ncbi:MAG: NUDIX hydrolase [Polaribacter sp.]